MQGLYKLEREQVFDAEGQLYFVTATESDAQPSLAPHSKET